MQRCHAHRAGLSGEAARGIFQPTSRLPSCVNRGFPNRDPAGWRRTDMCHGCDTLYVLTRHDEYLSLDAEAVRLRTLSTL